MSEQITPSADPQAEVDPKAILREWNESAATPEEKGIISALAHEAKIKRSEYAAGQFMGSQPAQPSNETFVDGTRAHNEELEMHDDDWRRSHGSTEQ